jgi:hypothetical protein
MIAGTRLPLELPAAPTGLFALGDGVVVAFADHPPMLVREQFGTLLGFVIGPDQEDEDEE